MGGNGIKKFEEFAIDWVQTRDGRIFDGDGARNEQWYGFGADVLAVADGSVHGVRRHAEPGAEYTADRTAWSARLQRKPCVPSDLPGVWAIYAHLQPGSITVKTGDQVKKGQVIGRLGNSGNSSGPHLHFQLSDGPEITTSNSLPFSLDSFSLVGTVDPAQLDAADARRRSAAAKGVRPRPPGSNAFR